MSEQNKVDKEPEVIAKIRDAFDVSFLKSDRERLVKQLWELTNKTDWENWRMSTLAVPYYAIADFIIQKQEFMKGKVDNILRHFKAEHLLGHGVVSPMGCTGCDLIKSMEDNNK